MKRLFISAKTRNDHGLKIGQEIQGINVVIENFGPYMKTRPVHLADKFTIDALEDWGGPPPKADGFMWLVGLGWGAHDCAWVSFTEEDGTELR